MEIQIGYGIHVPFKKYSDIVTRFATHITMTMHCFESNEVFTELNLDLKGQNCHPSSK